MVQKCSLFKANSSAPLVPNPREIIEGNAVTSSSQKDTRKPVPGRVWPMELTPAVQCDLFLYSFLDNFWWCVAFLQRFILIFIRGQPSFIRCSQSLVFFCSSTAFATLVPHRVCLLCLFSALVHTSLISICSNTYRALVFFWLQSSLLCLCKF